jgi:hypothetical protein
MTSLLESTLPIPTYHILLLLTISTVAILFGKVRTALLTNYAFALYWAYFFNGEQLLGSAGSGFHYYTLLYFGFGLLFFILAVIGFLFNREN